MGSCKRFHLFQNCIECRWFSIDLYYIFSSQIHSYVHTLTHGHTNIHTIINFNHIPRVISWISLSWTLTGYAHHIWHVLLMRSCVSMYNMSHANINLLKSSRYDWFVHGIFIIWTVITMHGRILKVPVKRSITGNKNAKF